MPTPADTAGTRLDPEGLAAQACLSPSRAIKMASETCRLPEAYRQHLLIRDLLVAHSKHIVLAGLPCPPFLKRAFLQFPVYITGCDKGPGLQALEGELVVAGVFVRLYNEQADFPIPDPPAFCKSLVAFINMESKALPSSPAMSRTSSGRLRPKSPGPPERGDASVVAKGIGKASWKEDAQTMRRRHLVEALLAFQNVLEAHQRLAALMASRSALAPLLNCIEPACRCTPLPWQWGLITHGHLIAWFIGLQEISRYVPTVPGPPQDMPMTGQLQVCPGPTSALYSAGLHQRFSALTMGSAHMKHCIAKEVYAHYLWPAEAP